MNTKDMKNPKMKGSFLSGEKIIFLLAALLVALLIPKSSVASVSYAYDVDTSGDVGQYCSIAVDLGSNAHISYLDTTSGNLKYATNASGPWVPTIMNTTSLGHTSIAVDSNNEVHITDMWDTAGTGQLRYTSNCGGGTFDAIIDSDTGWNVGQSSSIAVDLSDIAYVSYYHSEGFLRYAYADICTWPWNVGVIDGGIHNVGEYSSIAVDSNGKIHISYYDLTNQDLKYATNSTTIERSDYHYIPAGTGVNTATWPFYLPFAGTYNVYAWWKADPTNATDAPYTIVYDGGSATIDVDQTANGGMWNLLGTFAFAAGNNSVFITNDATAGNVVADAIMLEVLGDTDKRLIVDDYDSPQSQMGFAGPWTYVTGVPASDAYPQPNFWVTYTIERLGNVGLDTSIAIDSNDKVHISYQDFTNLDLKHATNASGSWVTTIVDSDGDQGYKSSIAISPPDYEILISYIGQSFFTGMDLNLAYNRTGSWQGDIGQAVGYMSDADYNDIDTDSSRNVHFCYHEISSGDLRYVLYDNVAPIVVDTVPTPDATDVPLPLELSASFSEHMFHGSLDSDSFRLQISGDPNNIPGTVTYIPTLHRAVFNPNINLSYGETFTATVTQDVEDEHYINMEGNVSWSFTTEAGYTLTVNKAGTGSGSVISSPAGIECGPTCSFGFADGSTVTLAALPIGGGSIFTGWSGGGCSGIGFCVVTMNSNTAVTATFDLCPLPGTPSQVSPVNGASGVNLSPTLDWTDVAGATNYIVEVCADSGCTSPVTSYTTSVSQWVVPGGILNPSTTYWWLVEAANACGIGPASTTWSFTTMNTCVSDNDGDGYGNPGDASCPNGAATDCDDSDPLEFPGQSWVTDSDQDGYKPELVIVQTQCTQPAGYTAQSVALPGDCDDDDASINPDGTEICDGYDNNCDTTVDEGMPDGDTDGLCDLIDYCPTDADNDSVDTDQICTGANYIAPMLGGNDNCPSDYNTSQGDDDGDLIGNVCDTCPLDNTNTCVASLPVPSTGDKGGRKDPPADPCSDDGDDDSDDDGYCDGAGYDVNQKDGGNDNCPGAVYGAAGNNPLQADMDDDQVGDVCDPDADGDGHCAPGTSNGHPEFAQCIDGAVDDCEPTNGSIFPGGPDPSDGIDNNCNGQIDEDVPFRIEMTLYDANNDPIDPSTWLPEIGETVKVVATVIDNSNSQPVVGEIVDFSIPAGNITAYVDKYTNDRSGVVTEDFIYNPADLNDGDNELTLVVDDMGAWIKIHAEARTLPPQVDYPIPPDADDDKVADSWEALYGGDLNPNVDSDGDGLLNIDEYRTIRWGKMLSCTDIYASPGTYPDLVSICDEYDTEGYLPIGVDYIRTNPLRENLFVKYQGYGTHTHNAVNYDFPFALGSAFHNAGIDVCAVSTTEATTLSLEDKKIDFVTVSMSTVAPTRDGHTLKKGTRNWEFDTVGSSCVGIDGANPTYGDDPGLAASQNCFPPGTNVYWKAILFYYKDQTYIDGDDNGCTSPDTVLNPISNCDDANDNGVKDGGEGRRLCDRTTLDGDRKAILADCGGIILCNYEMDLSAVDIESDGRVELPLYSDPSLLSSSHDANEYEMEQVTKHVTTHELGHSIGSDHTSVDTCVMYEATVDWLRDNLFTGAAYIHNSE